MCREQLELVFSCRAISAIAAAKAGDTLDCRWEPDTDIAHWLAKSLA